MNRIVGFTSSLLPGFGFAHSNRDALSPRAPTVTVAGRDDGRSRHRSSELTLYLTQDRAMTIPLESFSRSCKPRPTIQYP